MRVSRETFEFLKNTVSFIEPQITNYGFIPGDSGMIIELYGDEDKPSIFCLYRAKEGQSANEWEFLRHVVLPTGKSMSIDIYDGNHDSVVVVSEKYNRKTVVPTEYFYDEYGNFIKRL